jgi:hypothetical protein
MLAVVGELGVSAVAMIANAIFTAAAGSIN